MKTSEYSATCGDSFTPIFRRINPAIEGLQHAAGDFPIHGIIFDQQDAYGGRLLGPLPCESFLNQGDSATRRTAPW